MSLMVSLKLNSRRCLVIGSSPEAAERVLRLLGRGALICWVTRGVAKSEALGRLAKQQRTSQGRFLEDVTPEALLAARDDPQQAYASLQIEATEFVEGHLDQAFMVVLADRDDELAETVHQLCEIRNTLYCALDQPKFGNFSHVALVDSGPLSLGISTEGKAPALARALQGELLRLFGSRRVVRYFERLAALRTSAPKAQRRSVLNSALAGFSIHGEVIIPAIRKPETPPRDPEQGK